MIDRRKLLIGTGAATITACAFAGRAVIARAAATAGLQGLVVENEEAEQLLYALARLEARYYTEEGVSMVLACEDLAGEAGPFLAGDMNAQFAAAYRHYAALLNDLRRDLAAQDAVGVLELLAWRDFESGGEAGQ